MKPKKHLAEQLVSSVIEPEVELRLTLKLTDEAAISWRKYAHEHRHLRPSNGQLAESLIRAGLGVWETRQQ